VSIFRVFPNWIARSRVEKKVFVGDEIEKCRDFSGLAYRRPFERVSITVQRYVMELGVNSQT